MDVKAANAKVVSLAGYAARQAEKFDARAQSNAELAPGERVRQNDAAVRGKRFVSGEGTPQKRPASVLDFSFGRHAAQVGAYVAQGKLADALGLLLFDAVQSKELPVPAPTTESSHVFVMRGDTL